MVKDASLVEENLGLVHSCARRFAGRGIEYDDLYGAGCVGLVKAARGFDNSLGFAFSTYAVPIILGEIKRLFRDGGSFKVSRAMKERALALMRQNEELRRELGCEPTVSQLAEKAGLDCAETAELLCAVRPPLSLTPEGEEDEIKIEIPVGSHEDEVIKNIFISQLIGSLAPNDKLLLELRYFKNMTQGQTAQILGMSQVQVSRREKKLLGVLRERAQE